MKKYSVEKCVGNEITVLGVYETKEEMLAAKAKFKQEYANEKCNISGVYADMNDDGTIIPGLNGSESRKLF